ncbi:phenoloxidase-activating factor 2 isoform X2 [Drosophila innubila]|nr:phenoloxidase-activating factor 2 isoform X2 [Drosophila innubila]
MQQGKCGSRVDLWFHLHQYTSTKEEAKFGEFPWLVAIYDKGGYLCSGALITPGAVLTAANCVHGKRKYELRVVAGEWDAAVELEPFAHQTRPVHKLLVHPNYTQSMSHNLALLLISHEKPFQLTAHVHVICLPSPEIIHNLRDCYVAGWHLGDFLKNRTLLRRSSLFVLPRDQCVSKLRMTIFGRHFTLNDTLLCAGGEKDSFVCDDPGAIPLMCLQSNSNNRFALIGLLARATNCDGPQLLGVYSNVLLYRKWIDLKLNEHDVELDRYMIN